MNAGMQEIDMVHICMNCFNFPTLRIVNLEGNPIDDDAGCLLVSLLLQYSKYLETIILKATQIKINTIAQLVTLMDNSETKVKDHILKNISIGYNPLEQEDFCKFLCFIPKCNTLQILDLSGLGLIQSTFKLISKIIRYDKHIEDLDISANIIDRDSLRLILSALARNRKLKKFRLCQVGLDDSLFKMFQVVSNKGIKELYLNHNLITDEGLYIIKDIILGIKLLEVISIDENKIKNLKRLRENKGEIERSIKCELKIGTKHT